MNKLVTMFLNLIDPPSRMEQRMERRWMCRLKKIQQELIDKKVNEKYTISVNVVGSDDIGIKTQVSNRVLVK
jgi:hypothetical protein